MKKFILFILIVAGTNYAYAQQGLRPAKPKLFDNQKAWPQPFLNDSLFKTKPNKNAWSMMPGKQSIKHDNAVVFYSRMPVVKPAKGGSRMPVLDLNRDNTLYNMPVAKVDIVNPDTVGMENVIP